mgnify:CR=1 FL=1
MPRRKKDEEIIELPTAPDWLAHSLFALNLAWLLNLDPQQMAIAVAFALLPDLDVFLGHRVVLHNLFAVIGIPLLVSAAIPQVPLRAALLGSLSHIALDMLSPTGVALLWPVSNTMLSIPLINLFIRSGVRTLIFVLIIILLTNYTLFLSLIPSLGVH